MAELIRLKLIVCLPLGSGMKKEQIWFPVCQKKVPGNYVCFRLNVLPTTLLLLALSWFPDKEGLVRIGYQVVGGE